MQSINPHVLSHGTYTVWTASLALLQLHFTLAFKVRGIPLSRIAFERLPPFERMHCMCIVPKYRIGVLFCFRYDAPDAVIKYWTVCIMYYEQLLMVVLMFHVNIGSNALSIKLKNNNCTLGFLTLANGGISPILLLYNIIPIDKINFFRMINRPSIASIREKPKNSPNDPKTN